MVAQVQVASAAVKLRLDVNFGDPITWHLPPSTTHPCARLTQRYGWGYRMMTVLAE